MTFARFILAAALLVGIAADALLRAGFQGIGFPLWIAILALIATALAHRDHRALSREAQGWLLVAVIAASGLAWRAESELLGLDFLATLLALGLAAVAIGQPEAALLGARVRDSVWAGARVLRDVFVGAAPLALRALLSPNRHDRRDPTRRRGAALLRTAMIVVALVAVFGSLLRGADPIFASLLRIPDFDFGAVMSHLLVIGFFGWVFAGWSRGAFISPATASRAPDRLPLTLGTSDVTAALVTLDVLFALFIIAQLGWLFGGEGFLQARTGLTAAQYARGGFFQMVVVVVLVLPLLLATRALATRDDDAARRHTQLATPMVVLLLAMIASAALRMRLYVRYFGLTTDRFYTLAFMAWLAIVLVWLAATTLRGRDRQFVGGAAIAGFATLLVLNVVVPDRVVASVNVARARQSAPAGGSRLDVDYLSRLSGDAIEAAIAATLKPPTPSFTAGADRDTLEVERCRAARRIRARWGPSSPAAAHASEPGAWRRWNAGDVHALHLAAENETVLRSVQHASCAAARGASGKLTIMPAYR
jgi:hypothetical protein